MTNSSPTRLRLAGASALLLVPARWRLLGRHPENCAKPPFRRGPQQSSSGTHSLSAPSACPRHQTHSPTECQTVADRPGWPSDGLSPQTSGRRRQPDHWRTGGRSRPDLGLKPGTAVTSRPSNQGPPHVRRAGRPMGLVRSTNLRQRAAGGPRRAAAGPRPSGQ